MSGNNGKLEHWLPIEPWEPEPPRRLISEKAREVIAWHVNQIINNPDAARSPWDIKFRRKKAPEEPIIEPKSEL